MYKYVHTQMVPKASPQFSLSPVFFNYSICIAKAKDSLDT